MRNSRRGEKGTSALAETTQKGLSAGIVSWRERKLLWRKLVMVVIK